MILITGIKFKSFLKNVIRDMSHDSYELPFTFSNFRTVCHFLCFSCEFCANAYNYCIYVYMLFIEGHKVE